MKTPPDQLPTSNPICSMKLNALLLLALTAGILPLHANQPGFESLFDGRSLASWEGDTKFWRVENGAIVGETTADNPTPGRKNTFLIYRGDNFDDFELRFRYKVEGYNSGVQYRSVDKGGYMVHGLQADFEAPWHEEGKQDRFSGMFFEEGGRMFMGQRGDVVIVRANPEDPKKPKIEKIATVGDPKELARAIKPGEWNDYTVIARGNQFIHIINGRVMSIGIDEDELNFRTSGILAFQLHGGRPMKIEVKDIRLRRIK
jgi:hypothetical protein